VLVIHWQTSEGHIKQLFPLLVNAPVVSVLSSPLPISKRPRIIANLINGSSRSVSYVIWGKCRANETVESIVDWRIIRICANGILMTVSAHRDNRQTARYVSRPWFGTPSAVHDLLYVRSKTVYVWKRGSYLRRKERVSLPF
jgi:hypothetical protein